MKENTIEWLSGQDVITATLTQKKYITKVKKLAEMHPDKVTYIENKDGSLVAKMPLKTLKLSIVDTSGRDYSGYADRMKKIRSKKQEE